MSIGLKKGLRIFCCLPIWFDSGLARMGSERGGGGELERRGWEEDHRERPECVVYITWLDACYAGKRIDNYQALRKE